MARCSTCSAPVIWARTLKGSRNIFDAEPVDDGEWSIIDGIAIHARRDGMPTYRPHWATCPQADQHRKKKPG